jgi:hypothetical protein
MNKLVFPLALAAFVFISAEVRTQTPPLPPSPTVKLTAEQDHTIKEIVLKDFNFPKAAAADYKVGDAAPGNVELQSFPEPVASRVTPVKSHKFFVSGEKIVIVDPKDNKVADVIE